MKSLVCFYKDNQYIYSDNYLRIECNSDVFEFLSEVEQNYTLELKIVQVDFDLKSACIFIINTYTLLTPLLLADDVKVDLEFTPQISKQSFCSKIVTIQKDISAGRYYQVNLTSSLISQTDEDSFLLFKKFFSVFKSRYSAFLPMKNFEILCYSPELFLEKNDSTIKTQPIKGTLLSKNSTDLMESKKETAELSMIVDLLRNDLNGICTGPVVVTKHRELLDLGYTQHTYSEISGETELQLPQILKLTLPGGSISGCPKIESLKAIAELEESSRGFYTGVIGWWQNNNFKLNLAIRSIKKENTELTYYAGCGIVYDSVPELEWQEFLTKAGKLKIKNV